MSELFRVGCGKNLESAVGTVWSRFAAELVNENLEFGASYLVNDFVTSFNNFFVFIFFDELDARF